MITNIQAENVIRELCRQFIMPHNEVLLDVWSTNPNMGLYFHYDLRAENHGYEKDGNTHHEEWQRAYSRSIHLIVTARHRVYVAVCGWPTDLKDVLPEQWVNTSNHDSCWHSVGLRVIWEETLKARDECWRGIPEEHRQNACSMFNHLNDGVFGPRGMLNFVKIERGARRKDNDYFDTILSVKPVQFKLELIEEQE